MITHHEYPCLHTPDMTRTLVASIIAALFVCVAPSVGRAQPRPIQSSRWQWHVAVSGAMNTRTASHNEPISDGELSAVAVQGTGVAWFDQVVPYGKATQANFTVAPAVAVQHDVGSQDAFALGYALHHLSNASMGGANPGMNSHLLFVRWARKR
jgi:hypothetical protein